VLALIAVIAASRAESLVDSLTSRPCLPEEIGAIAKNLAKLSAFSPRAPRLRGEVLASVAGCGAGSRLESQPLPGVAAQSGVPVCPFFISHTHSPASPWQRGEIGCTLLI
jgi:hypothetical protein